MSEVTTQTRFELFTEDDLDELLSSLEDSDRYISEYRKTALIKEINIEKKNRGLWQQCKEPIRISLKDGFQGNFFCMLSKGHEGLHSYEQ